VTVAVTVFGECPDAARSCEAAPGWEMNCSSRAPRAFGGGSSPTPGRGLALGRIGGRASASLARLAEGMAARGSGAHAMMDLSDGLGLDLHRFADASGVDSI